VIHSQHEAEGKELGQMKQVREGKLLGRVGTQSAGQQPGYRNFDNFRSQVLVECGGV